MALSPSSSLNNSLPVILLLVVCPVLFIMVVIYYLVIYPLRKQMRRRRDDEASANPFEIQSSSADTAETRRDLHRWVPTLPPPTPTTPGFSPGPRSPRSRESEHSFQTESVSLIASQSAPSTRSLRPESRPISELVDILPTPNTNVSIPLTPPPSAFISPRTMDYRYAYAGLQPELRRDPFSDPDPSLNPFSDPGPSYVTVRRADSNNTHAYVYAAPREVEFEREHDGAVAVSKPPPAASTRSSVDAVSITTSSTLPPSYRTHRPTHRTASHAPFPTAGHGRRRDMVTRTAAGGPERRSQSRYPRKSVDGGVRLEGGPVHPVTGRGPGKPPRYRQKA